LSSTSSSDRSSKNRSATEALASRYRHLFVLPSAPQLILYSGLACLLISFVSKGTGGIFTFALALLVFLLSASAISSALLIIDRKTIATMRRVLAMLMAAQVLWLLIAVVGAAYSWASGSSYPLTNAILFGSFVAAGFEFLVIHGAFQKSAAASFLLALVHPASTVIIIRTPELTKHLDPVAASGGALALVLFVVFPTLLQRRKTSLGHDALSLFQAFMKTWTAGDSGQLEQVIAEHAEEVEVTTKVLRFRTKVGDTYLILPGVHPGPFHPVGSYDLPGVVSRAFGELGPVMTLHRPGGHERNLATRADTGAYASSVAELAKAITSRKEQATLRGPLLAQVGKATISASSFADDLVMTISFAPLGSDDIDTHAEDELAKTASDSGFDLSVVDAHNSIDPDLQSPSTDDPGWKRVFEEVGVSKPKGISIAYSHSNEIGFAGRGDLTENGLGLLMVEAEGRKSALLLADANNSVPDLRARVRAALDSAGYDLIEFCTSDSHNLAARGLTAERGYEALGEATPPEEITGAIVKMADLAASRLSPAEYGSAKMKSKVKVFGSKALGEFAALTQASSTFSKRYFQFATAAWAVLLLASVFL
jgi:putative membrane protein